MSDVAKHVHARIVGILVNHIEPIFKRGTKFAVIARTPGNDEADVLVTDDDVDALIKLLERSRAREAIK